jgi:phosphatidylglycerol:prolipoprotein diacylglycerol transferase
VLGGLLGGYADVEWTKHLVGHKQSTGDAFALIIPVGLFLGRLGCLAEGFFQGRLSAGGGCAGPPRKSRPVSRSSC